MKETQIKTPIIIYNYSTNALQCLVEIIIVQQIKNMEPIILKRLTKLLNL